MIFILICLCYGFATLITNEFILSDGFYYNSFSEQLTFERINDLISSKNKWVWLSYAIIPLSIGIKTFLISICIGTGAFLSGYKISLKKLFSIVMKADLVFALAAIINSLIILFFFDISSFEDLKDTNSFSLLSFFNTRELSSWLYYPLGAINLFEIIYWVFLAIGIGFLIDKRFSNGFKIVASSYGTGFLIWIVFVTFLQLNFS